MMERIRSEPNGHLRRTREFHKAMQVVERLNTHISTIIRRYNISNGNLNSAYLYSLRLRLATIEGVRGLYLEYARSKMYGSAWQQDADEAEQNHSSPSATEEVEEDDPNESFQEVRVDQNKDEEEEDEDNLVLCNVSEQPTDDVDVESVGVEKQFASFSTYSVPDFATIQGNQTLREVRHLGDQIGNVVLSDEGETTLEDLSDDEMDFVTEQVITHQCRM